MKMIRGQGMPSYRLHNYGNMFVQFDVKFPENNFASNPAAYETLKSIIPPSVIPITPPLDMMTETVYFEDVDPTQQARAQGATAMDEDDDDGHPHGSERVQCASQ